MTLHTKDYNQNDCLLLRILCLLGAVVTPIVKIAWSYSISPTDLYSNTGSIIQSFFFTGLFLSLFLATFLLPFVKRNAYAFTYAIYFLTSATFIYSVAYDNFSVQSLLLLILIHTSVNMIVKKISHLIYYDAFFFLLLSLAIIYVTPISVSKLFLIFFFLLYCVFNLVFVRIKLKTQNDLSKSEQDYHEKIQYMAFHDTLTGLPNRYQLNHALQNIISEFSKADQKAAILFIDLDRFKTVNDSLGHNNGDILLKQVSDRLVQCVRKDDIVSRYGGDEFVILLNGYNRIDGCPITNRILEAFQNPFIVNNNEIYITPSIGISLYPEDGLNVNTLIKNADSAMYQAKQKGKNTYQFYSTNMEDKFSNRLELENALHKAVKNQELELYYQPQICLKTHKIIGLEALLRWRHPKYGIISPCIFIPLAEETGLINEIGEWVLYTACAQNKSWQEAGLPCLPVSVNVSRHQLMYSNFLATLQNALMKTGISPEYIDIELTESIMQEIDSISLLLGDIKALGVKISIDDFGTGYSSLNILKSINIDNLKIDISFIKDITTNPRADGIVKAIINMGHSLNLKVIAEGVEQEAQYTLLKNSGCDSVQGYYFSKPEPAAIIEKNFLRNEL